MNFDPPITPILITVKPRETSVSVVQPFSLVHAKFHRDTFSHFFVHDGKRHRSSRGPKVKLDPKLTLMPWLLNGVKKNFKKMKIPGVLEKLHKIIF